MKANKNTVLTGIRPVAKHESIAEAVYLALRDAIVSGDLKPGMRLVEQRLSDRMEVSRIPVREAIKRLEQGGFVQKLPVRGVMVRKISEKDSHEAFGIRAVLEGYAISRALEHTNGEMLVSLEHNIEASSAALRQEHMKKAANLDNQFHEMIYKAAKSEMLATLIRTLRDYTERYRKPLLNSLQHVHTILDGHRALVEAMRRADKRRAEEIMKVHILWDLWLICKD